MYDVESSPARETLANLFDTRVDCMTLSYSEDPWLNENP